MSKSVTIPAWGPNPWTCTIDGATYAYEAGATVTVPDAVAAIVERWEALQPHPHEGGGGSSGGELPAVTAADNGKVLGVSEGAWGKMDAPTGLPDVSGTDAGKVLTVDEDGEWTPETPADPAQAIAPLEIDGYPAESDGEQVITTNAAVGDLVAAAKAGRAVLIKIKQAVVPPVEIGEMLCQASLLAINGADTVYSLLLLSNNDSLQFGGYALQSDDLTETAVLHVVGLVDAPLKVAATLTQDLEIVTALEASTAASAVKAGRSFEFTATGPADNEYTVRVRVDLTEIKSAAVTTRIFRFVMPNATGGGTTPEAIEYYAIATSGSATLTFSPTA